jgi:N-acetylglucosaminyldiphosphoundecaprenol N-acetyl-beta-D-mannosaminyltransferase
MRNLRQRTRKRQSARERRPAHRGLPANTHIIVEARRSPAFGKIISKFDLVLPDGMPIDWALNAPRRRSS